MNESLALTQAKAAWAFAAACGSPAMSRKEVASMPRLGVVLAVCAVVVAVCGSAVAQTRQPIWDKIQSSGVMVAGVMIASQPGVWKDVRTANYKGFYVNFARAIAEDLSKAMGKTIRLEFVETTWASVVLDLQAAKIDLWSGMSVTPQRLQAIDMAGPMYELAHCYVNRKGLDGLKTWADYSKSEIKIATTIGTSDERAIKELSPNATHLGFKDEAQAMLAVQAGRADALGTSVLICLDIKKRNPELGRITFPTPVKSLPSSAGMRKDGDGRFHNFVQTWADKSRASGLTKKLIIDAVREAGLNPEELPGGFSF
jgi:polar amino acid transport system substrate-binding protein